MDIEMYNYSDKLFEEYKSGVLDKEEARKRGRIYEQRFDIVLKERVEYIFEPQISTIVGTVLRRVNSDAMNNYYVETVAKSFTNIQEILS
mmetsp:Transcript_628/g.723  ORF Transcript_628/g.723 Transcript_628/m.723 type:complete len:90 (+) Transcript_628:912-1181(+)